MIILIPLTLALFLLAKFILLDKDTGSFALRFTFFTILLIFVLGLIILIWLLCGTLAIGSSSTEVIPTKQFDTINSIIPIKITYSDDNGTFIEYSDSIPLSTKIIQTHGIANVEVQQSPNNTNYIEVYRAKWGSVIRTILYGPYIPSYYYIVYTTGD